MIDSGDNIVTVSYPYRDSFGGPGAERTETYTLVGKSENIAKMVSGQVERWLKNGGARGPMTLHVVGPYSVIDADDRAERES